MSQQGPFNPQQGMPPSPSKGLSAGCIIGIVVAIAGVFVIGIMGSLAIYGVRKYLVAAKSAEAKNTVSAISRSAEAAYDPTKHTLCPSSGAVPTFIPKGVKYHPAPTDYQTPGWKCLRFSIATPSYYQYQYNQGGGYVALANAPGPNGFEAAAQGDLDANGVNSTFSRTGKIGPAGDLVLETAIFTENETE